MLYKPRKEPVELQIIRSLNNRMNLSDKEKLHVFSLQKGYKGEVMFDALTEKLQCECLILNDLLLKINNTNFQIDSLVIFSETLYLFEIKNFEGDYYYEGGRLYKIPKTEINNPITQLLRSESLLRQLINELGFSMNIKASIVFINPELSLYQAPLDKPIILPTQVRRFFKKLNTTQSKISKKHKLLADKLMSLHMEESPFMQLPPYEYDQLRKGIICAECDSFPISVEGRNCVCTHCGYQEPIATAVMRSVDELKLLFPDLKITTNLIHEWCNVVESKRRIRKILQDNFRINGIHQWSFYE